MYNKKRRMALVFITVFFIISTVYVFESGVFKHYIRFNIEKKLGAVYKAKVRIEKISGGFFSGIILEDVSLDWGETSSINFIEAKQILTTLHYHQLLFPWFKMKGSFFLSDTLIQLKRYLKVPYRDSLISLNSFSQKRRQDTLFPEHLISFNDGYIVLDNVQDVQFKLKTVSLRVLHKDGGTVLELLGISPTDSSLNKFFFKDYYNNKTKKSETHFYLMNFSFSQLTSLSPHVDFVDGYANVELHAKNGQLIDGDIKIKELQLYLRQKNTTTELSFDCDITFLKDILTVTAVTFKYNSLSVALTGWIKNFYKDPMAQIVIGYNDSDTDVAFTIFGPLTHLKTHILIKNTTKKVSLFKSLEVNAQVDNVYMRLDGIEVTGFSGTIELEDNFYNIPFSGQISVNPGGIFIKKLTVADVFTLEGKMLLQPKMMYDLLFYTKKGATFSEILSFFNIKTSFLDDTSNMTFSSKVSGSLDEIMIVPEIQISNKKAQIEINAQFDPLLKELKMKAHDFFFGKFTVDTDMTISKTGIKEDLVSYNFLLDHIAINDISLPMAKGTVSYNKTDSIVMFHKVNFENLYEIDGMVDFLKKEVDVTLNFNNSNVLDLMFFMEKGKKIDVQGTLNGFLRIYGAVAKPSLTGKIKFENGTILTVPFDVCFFDLDGTGTILSLKNSRLIRGNYQTLITGYIDLKLSNIFSNVKFESDQKSTYIGGFDIERSDYSDEVTIKKGLVDNWTLNIKTRPDEDKTVSVGKERATEFELEYSYTDKQNLFFRIEEDEGAFGVKRKYSF
ncbi:hypothetical protein ACFL1T_02285 [Chlamydiota bacterium]